jgi:hypothetical protein
MKRRALLEITGCTIKAFETYSSRGFLPFSIRDSRWSDYSIEDAFALKVLTDAAAVTDLATASTFARGALKALHPLNPFAYMGDDEVWIALINYEDPEGTEGGTGSVVVAGRWRDIDAQARARLECVGPTAKLTSVLALSATRTARDVLQEARDFDLPEAEVPPIPEDVSGYPEWFVENELARRAVLFERDEGGDA